MSSLLGTFSRILEKHYVMIAKRFSLVLTKVHNTEDTGSNPNSANKFFYVYCIYSEENPWLLYLCLDWRETTNM